MVWRERAVVERIRRGDRAAAERFVREHTPGVHRFLRYLTGRADEADDLTQETFVKAWQALSGFRGEASLATWLRRIAYREYQTWLRSRKEHLWIGAVAEMAAPGDAAVERLELAEALATLSVEHRDAFLMHYVEGLTAKELAVILEIPLGTVLSRLHHARRSLRRILRSEETHDEPHAAQSAFAECPGLPAVEPRTRSC